MSAKQKMLETLCKTDGYNTFSTKQAQVRFGIKNVAARIHELRLQGYSIYTNTRTKGDGTKVSVYRLGKPSKSMKKWFKSVGVRPQTV